MPRLFFREIAPVPEIVNQPKRRCVASSQEVLLDGSNPALVREHVLTRVLLESGASLRASCSSQQIFYPASAEGRDMTRRKHTCGNARHSQAQGYTFQFGGLGEGAAANVGQIFCRFVVVGDGDLDKHRLERLRLSTTEISRRLITHNARATPRWQTIKFIRPLSTSSVIAASSSPVRPHEHRPG